MSNITDPQMWDFDDLNFTGMPPADEDYSP
nr:Chain B, C-X-C chemokine receptor type 1 [Homo sapiens]